MDELQPNSRPAAIQAIHSSMLKVTRLAVLYAGLIDSLK